ncbi:enoyl-CoA hydratase-related protein [Nonomuraea sp. NPDC050556]|uniref:enoyl-CoA hydratase-related protein n=1 Tax=Nonomuraea sp. NPDC050556 TaxID=3364369 RepID=UPI0037B52C56
MSVDYEQVGYHVSSGIASIYLARPHARNSYTVTMADELADALDRADADDEVRVVVLQAEGDDFCVGADLSGGAFDLGAEDDETWDEPAGRCSMRIFALRKPVIAVIQGAAVGAGSTIVLPCDFRLASPDARFGFVFTRRGIVPEGASAWFLPRLVGMGKALDWMVSGRVFGADEALAAGMVSEVRPREELLRRAYSLAEELASKTAPVAVAITRQMLYRLSGKDSPEAAHRLDSRLIAGAMATPDAMEGIASFLERRSPNFPGRVSSDLPEYLPWT